MFSPRTILCPVDFDSNYEAALKLARDIAELTGASIHLLHVARIPHDQMDVPIPFENDPHWEQVAQSNLESIASANLGNLRHEIVVRSGIPDIDVVRIAVELGVGLIVMSTHGRKGLSHFLLGSVAEKVVREAPCPVITVRSQPTPSQPQT